VLEISYPPTAVQSLADEHETESRNALALGRATPARAQRDPFQRSANPAKAFEVVS
jgi:hypothetical protein